METDPEIRTTIGDNKIPKEFWRFLKSNKNSPLAYISTNDWYNYFSNLFNPIIESDNDFIFHEEAITVTDELLDAPMHRLLVSEIRQSILNLKSSKFPRIDGIQSYLKLHVINFYHFWKYCSINFIILQSSRKIGLYQLLHSFLKREIQVYLTTISVFVYSQLLVKFTQIS